MKIFAVILFLMSTNVLFCQNKKVDSLRQIIYNTKNNSSKINSLNNLAYHFFTLNLHDSAILYAKKTIELAKPISFNTALGRAYNTLGLAAIELGNVTEARNAYTEAKKYFQSTSLSKITTQELLTNHTNFGNLSLSSGNNNEAIQSFKEGLELAKALKNDKEMAGFYLSLSMAYATQGNYAESLKNNLEGLKLHEKLGDEKGMAWSYNDIGDTHMLLGNTESAIEYFSRCYVLAKKNNVFSIASLACFNIGDIYFRKKQDALALQYAQIAMDLATKTDELNYRGNALLLMGKIYREQRKYEKALQTQEEAIRYYEKGNTALEAYESFSEISKIYFEQNNQQQAVFYGAKGLALAQQMNSPLAIKVTSETLFQSYQLIGDYQKAYQTHRLFVTSRDTLLNENNQKELLYQQYKQQVLADSLKYDSNKKISDIENKTKLQSAQNKLILTGVGLLITLGLGGLLFQRFNLTQKQKAIIEEQNKSLEQKTKEIQDSILYSKEIQNTFLKSIVNNHSQFKDALLIYKPKDVVSGDFYWYKEIGDNLFVVVGDCSGHGVPGAIISVLAIQSLEKIIHQITSPLELHKLSALLKQEFDVYYKQENHVSIGLDFSVLCLNHKQNSLFLSGSGGTILLKNSNNKIIAEQFDSINIGGSMPLMYDPKTVSYDFNEIRSVFLYTDGIIDQRGGDKNKKFGSSQLKNLLENLNTKNTSETLAKIESTIDNWKGSSKQMDDITFLGLQINA